MPGSWLSVPHFHQELDYSCVAACARMVLAHYGDIRTEAELRLLLDTRQTGTRAGNLMRINSATSRCPAKRSRYREPVSHNTCSVAARRRGRVDGARAA